ncbi:YceI family protein [Sphingomonas jatrophae]|uniref:Polyisoprenoid-binding protein YceI n=1 Tax=Sphingomonas jatrophae TaxID=1166337 RepID=A0A1I6JIR5_9SPHN|nr:YceI family protein [Sphingomonas jatrophae]SFR78926.1 Polyisoprenoid-binding protein YceI [Sphingomonas jatrophae]
MRLVLAATLLALAAPVLAQAPTSPPGAPDAKRVTAGTYTVDSGHTQILFTVNHLGFNSYWGIFGGATGTLVLDPAKPNAASVEITVPMDGIATTSDKLTGHLKTPDFFDAAKFPTATFKSTRVTVSGTTAKIAGNLTLKGVTRPVVLDAKFTGAGNGMMPPKALNVGFEATTSIKRSDFGVSYGVGLVSDVVPLKITVAFEKK